MTTIDVPVEDDGLPFEAIREVPNEETRAALNELKDLIAGTKAAKVYSDPEELFQELDECAKT